jgi:hypothetical protein
LWALGSGQKNSGQQAVGSEQWAWNSWQWTVNSGQWTVGSGWLAVNSGQWAVYSRQRTLNSRQWEVDNKQVAVGSGLEFSKIIFIPRNFAKYLQAKFYVIFANPKIKISRNWVEFR